MTEILSGKVVMVSAASKGLGFGIAKAALKSGARVSIASRAAQNVNAAVAALRKCAGGDVLGWVCDVRDPEAISAWVSGTVEAYGGVDGLVTNSGGPPPGPFESTDDAAWYDAFELNLLSTVRLIRAVLPSMQTSGCGSIVVLTSSSVLEPIDNLIVSNVMRAGISSMAKTLSREVAGVGIRVNNLVPGRIDTERVQALDQAAAKRLNVDLNQHQAKQRGLIPLGRYGTTDEFGAVAVFLLSSSAAYISGSTLVVDGGKTRCL